MKKDTRDTIVNVLVFLLVGFILCCSWNYIAPIYFIDFLPAIFINIPYWHVLAAMAIVNVLRSIIFKK